MNIRQSEIEKAAEKFKALLTAQCARAERMKNPVVALEGGDGIGKGGARRYRRADA